VYLREEGKRESSTLNKSDLEAGHDACPRMEMARCKCATMMLLAQVYGIVLEKYTIVQVMDTNHTYDDTLGFCQ